MEKRIDLLQRGLRFLTKEGLSNAQCEAEILLAHLLNCPRIELYLDNAAFIKEKNSQDYWDLLIQRAKGMPLQYLIGSTEFMGLKFKITAGVFIPRPETEILVETALELLGSSSPISTNVLDIGTGCGNIAISIAKELKKTHIFACDISDSALQLARENARLNKVEIYLLKSNLFCALKRKNHFSLIVSNPPYIDTPAIPGLARELHHEPKEALDGGKDGLFYYRKIINAAADYLRDNGLLVLEIGDDQGALVKEILTRNKKFSLFKVVRDYNGVERVIAAQKQK